jgi:YVTN family beta-propeller protein
VSDKPDVNPDTTFSTEKGSGVYILNEGNYGWGNGSVDYFSFSTGKVVEDVFQISNNRPLGDVCQSMEVFNEKAYLVVNNSSKIEIVNPYNFKSLGVITGLSSPRYFVGINSSKAYVSDFKSNSISVIDLNANSKVKSISCPGWTEEMIKVGNYVYVTNIYRNYIYIIDSETDVLDDSILLGESPNSLQVDKNGKLWVLCGGSSENHVSGKLNRINPITKAVELSLTFPGHTDVPRKLEINGAQDKLYYLYNGVNQFSIVDNSLPSSPFINQKSLLFYGLGVDPESGNIYVSDAIDYVQKGKVYCYKPDTALVNSFNSGLIPGEFYFY